MNEVLLKLEHLKVGKQLLRKLKNEVKNRVLLRISQKIIKNITLILNANQLDVDSYRKSKDFNEAYVDRLILNEKRIAEICKSLELVAEMNDPVGQVVEERVLENGLLVRRMKSPLGVIFIIFESRPNVITEAFSLAFKAGNALILKGGKESLETSRVIYRCIEESLAEENLNSELIFWGLLESKRDVTDFMMKQNKFIDVLIPRGGEKLIEHVINQSRIPIIKNDRGLCHIYVHEKANLEMTLEIIENAKTQRPSVCNSAETLLIDLAVANTFLPIICKVLEKKRVDFFVCEKAKKILSSFLTVQSVSEKSYDTEYLDLKLNIRVVENFEMALSHIEKYGSRHSESIITDDQEAAKNFQLLVDAAVVYWNASTRFTDGGQLGLGAEIGISTQKLHVRGPVGLDALTSLQWIIDGQGQIRKS